MKSRVAPLSSAERQALIARAYDLQTLRMTGERLTQLITEHFSQVQQGVGPVLNWETPLNNFAVAAQALAQGDADLVDASAPMSRLACDQPAIPLVDRFSELAAQCLARGQNLHHPHYVGHQVPASIPLAAWFDALGALTNQVMAIYEMGPWATSVEQAVVSELGAAIGFEPGRFGGLVTSGGSLANLTALLTARNVALGASWKRGIAGQKRAPVLVAHAESHYCVVRSAGILGLGTDHVVSAPLDSQRRIDVDQLDDVLGSLRRRGVPIVALSAAACATPIGAFDRLVDIAAACRRHDVWLHIDAAHGGAAALSAKYGHLVEGLALADSVVCDAHKMLFMPALCALVFYREKNRQFETFQQSAPYLFDPSAPGMAEYDSGVRSLECTKRAAALGLWGIWSMFGRKLFAAMVDQMFDLGAEFYQLLDAAPDFEPYCRPEGNIVVFRYLPSRWVNCSDDEIDRFQMQLRRHVIESGDFYLTQTRIDGRSYLRTTLINPLTQRPHLEALLERLRSPGFQPGT